MCYFSSFYWLTEVLFTGLKHPFMFLSEVFVPKSLPSRTFNNSKQSLGLLVLFWESKLAISYWVSERNGCFVPWSRFTRREKDGTVEGRFSLLRRRPFVPPYTTHMENWPVPSFFTTGAGGGHRITFSTLRFITVFFSPPRPKRSLFNP